MIIGNKDFNVKNNAYIMGILNVTPDSFSDGGKYNSFDYALKHVEEMIAEGADIIDIGGESTHPGYTMVSDDEEIARVIPIIKAVKERFDIPVSIDTYKSKVALEAIEAGADMVNDIWGFKFDNEVADVVKKYDVACCITHNRNNTEYKELVNDIISDLEESAEIAEKAGIDNDKIIIDPGVGFGKTYEQNLQIINHLEQLHCFGYPLLLGASNKSVIGTALNLPIDERLEGTIATTVVGAMKGAAFFRVHDIKENKRALEMTEKILGR